MVNSRGLLDLTDWHLIFFVTKCLCSEQVKNCNSCYSSNVEVGQLSVI